MSAVAVVHTSAHDVDQGTEPTPVIEIQGVLTHAAEVRTKVVGDDQHPVPVLCMDIRPLSGARRSIHAEQVFTESTRGLAEAKARDLKRGARVTFKTCLTGMRITFPHVRQIAIETAAATSQGGGE